jgi:HEAT repeat protein
MSEAYDNFLRSNFFGNPFNAWHDGLDTPALTALQGDDLARAEGKLLKALPDGRAVVGLGAIRSEKAVKPLLKLLDDHQHSTDAAVALFNINGDTRCFDAVIHALQTRKESSERMAAAIALRNFPIPKAVTALLAALDDSDQLVRHHAAISLLELYGQNPQQHANDNNSLQIRIMRPFQQAAAAAELHRIVQEGTLHSPRN